MHKSHLNRRPTCVALAVFAAIACCASSARADEADDLYRIGVGQYKQQRWELASSSFRNLVQKYPRHPKAALGRLYFGLTRFQLKDYKGARTVLADFVKFSPESKYRADAEYRIAECDYLLDDLPTAEQEFQQFLQSHPKHDLAQWALPFLGDAQLRQKKPTEAAASFRESLNRFPTSRMAEDAKFGLARSLEELEKPAEAVALYRELAAGRTTRAPEAQLKVGTLLFDVRQYDEAARAYDELERRFPESELLPTARLNAGYANYQLGEYRRAIAKLKAAAADQSQAQTAGYWMGVSHKELREYDQAVGALKSAFDSDPKSPMAEKVLHQWADCELRLEHFDAARKRFLQLVDTWPQGELADDSLYFAAEAALSEKDLDESEHLTARFEQEYGQSSLRLHHLLLKGRLLDIRGGKERQQQAAAIFEQVLNETEIPRTQWLARFHLARVWQKLGDDRKALESVGPLAAAVVNNESAREFADALVLQGVSFLADQKFDEAVGALEQYLKLTSDDLQADQALSTLAIAEARRGHQAASGQRLEELRRKYADSPLVPQTLQSVAEIAYETKDWNWAATVFEDLLQEGQGTEFHARGLSGLAWSLHAQKQHAEAATFFERLVREHPNDPLAAEAAYMRGKALQDAGEQMPAADAYAEAFRKFAPEQPAKPGDEQKGAAYYAFRGGLQAARMLRSQKDRIRDADAAYEQLLQKFPQPRELDKLLDEWALLNYEAANYQRADEIFARLIKEVPDSDLADNARLSLAESTLIAGKLDEARESLAELEASPQSDEQVQRVALSHLIAIAVEQQDWQQVRGKAQQLTRRFPESDERRHAEFYLAEALVQLNDVEAAQKLLLSLKAKADDESVGKADWFPRVWVLLAETYLRTKKYDQVRETVEQFRTADPQSPFLYQADEVVGRSYKNQGKLAEARAAFTRVVDSEAGRRTETACKSQFLIAETYLLQKNYEAALQEYLKVYYLYKFPDWQAPALFQAAQCDEALEKWKDAARAYEDLLRDFPESEFATKAREHLPAARRKAAG